MSASAGTPTAPAKPLAKSVTPYGNVGATYVPMSLSARRSAARIVDASLIAVSVACPLTKRWARTLSDEFKRGDCHAGRYETSLALAAGLAVRESYRDLPKRDVSLSAAIKEGKSRFTDMGMDRAYTGAPAEATSAEGDDLLDRLAEMIVTEVTEALAGG